MMLALNMWAKKTNFLWYFFYAFFPFILVHVHEKTLWSDIVHLRKSGYYGNSYHETCHLWQWCAFYWQRHRRRASQTWSRTLCLKRTADFHTPHMCTPPPLCCLHIYRKTPCQHIQRTNMKGWYSLHSFDVYSYIIRKHWAPLLTRQYTWYMDTHTYLIKTGSSSQHG